MKTIGQIHRDLGSQCPYLLKNHLWRWEREKRHPICLRRYCKDHLKGWTCKFFERKDCVKVNWINNGLLYIYICLYILIMEYHIAIKRGNTDMHLFSLKYILHISLSEKKKVRLVCVEHTFILGCICLHVVFA